MEPVQPTLVVTAVSVFVTRRLAGPRYTGGVSGTAPPCSWEMTTSTGSQGNVSAGRETAPWWRFVLINETTQPVLMFIIRTTRPSSWEMTTSIGIIRFLRERFIIFASVKV